MSIVFVVCVYSDECQASCLNDRCDGSFITDGPNTDICRCDSQCSFFQDCCQGFNSSSTICDSTIQTYSDTDISLWSCQSLYPSSVNITQFSPQQVGVYAVSKCPSTWLAHSQELGFSAEDTQLVENICSNADSNLPLTSDDATGRVYKNEYCALCSAVSRMAFWRHTILCSSNVLDMVQSQLQLTSDVIDQACGSCSYLSPPSFYLDGMREVPELPRSCTPAISSCPSFSEFEFDPALSAEDYQQVLNNCTQSTGYVQAFSSVYAKDVVFKNQYCLTCNDFPSLISPLCFEFDKSSFPLCKSTAPSSNNNLQVELVIDAVTGTIQVFDQSTGAQSILDNVTLPVRCSFGQIFDFVTRKCRTVSCFQFDLPGSDFPCSIVGYSIEGNTTDACSQEAVLNNHILLIPLNDTTFYYIPLLSIVFVSYFNERGLPVVCLDSAVPSDFFFLKVVRVLNTLTFMVVASSSLVFGFVVLMYTVPTSMRSVFGTVMASFATASLLTDLALLLGYPGAFLSGNGRLCYAAGILDHLFGLSQFYWLCVHSLDVGMRYYRTANSIPSCSTLQVLLSYIAVGCCLPIILTAFEIAVIFATGNMGSFSSCFQVSSFWTAFFFYILPCAVSVSISLAVSVFFLVHAIKSPNSLTGRVKCRFAALFILTVFMCASLLVRVSSLSLKSRFADILVGFFRLLVVCVVFSYMAVVFIITKKVRKVLCGCAKGSVRPATAECIEMAERSEVSGRAPVVTVSDVSQTKLSREMEEFAEQLERPWTYSKEARNEQQQ